MPNGEDTPERDIDRLQMSAWQQVDDEHPADAGKSAYRVVFKTLRVGVGDMQIKFPNLTVRFGHGDVNRGGVRLGSAVRGRQRGDWYLPEVGALVQDGQALRYRPDPPLNFQFDAWEDTIERVFFVEMILVCEETDPNARIAEGRRNLASLKTMLELRFGPRLLGLLLAEEIGELHDDGHWARTIVSGRLTNEWSLDTQMADQAALKGFNDGPLARQMGRPQSDRLRARLACDWYWSAIHAEEPVTEYLQLWFVVEAIAMPDTTNIAPVKSRLVDALGGKRENWELVGLLFGKRGNLVHGADERDIDDDSLAQLRNLVEVLLCLEFGLEDPERFDRLRAAAGLA